MSDYIMISPEQVKEEASTVRNYRQQYIDVMSKIKNLVLTLSESWDGEAQNAFVSKYQGMQKDFEKFAETLEEFAVNMDDISNKMQQTDLSLASQIRGL